MSTTTAIAVMAASQSAVASSQATQARQAVERTECKVTMTGFTNDAANIAQRQDYAACVAVLHPVESGPPTMQEKAEVLGLVAFFVVLACVGAWRMWRENGDGVDLVFGAILGLLVAAVLAVLGWGAWALFAYLAA